MGFEGVKDLTYMWGKIFLLLPPNVKNKIKILEIPGEKQY